MILTQRWKAVSDSVPIRTLEHPKKSLQMCAKTLSSANGVWGRKPTFFCLPVSFFYEWAMGNMRVCSAPCSCMGHCVWVMICLACHRWIDVAERLRGGLRIYRVDLTRGLPFLFWINKSVFFIQLLLALLELIIAYPFWLQGAAGMFSFVPLPHYSSTPPQPPLNG